jgi:DNA-binding transcriptional MerR regulator
LSTFGYSAQEVATVVGLPVGQVRAYVRAGFLAPSRGARGAQRFSFQDLVLLRTAKALIDGAISPRRVRAALVSLRERLPSGRPLSAMHIVARDGLIMVRDGSRVFEPESGQILFDFDVAPLGERVAPILRAVRTPAVERTSGEWFAWGCEIEIADPAAARHAYEQALTLEPEHADALVNLGRLCHEGGDTSGARGYYERALEAKPTHAVAAFNLGVALEDLGEQKSAIRSYRRALRHDPRCADAHYNLARLYERAGDRTRALSHLGAYQRLIRPA